MTLSSYIVFCLAFAAAAAMPGPAVAALVARALRSGPGAALPLMAGIITGDLIWFAAAALGLALLAATLGSLFVAIKYIGAAYLLYLAWRFWTAPVGEQAASAPPRGRGWVSYVLGVGITLSNPKAISFYLALMPVVLDLQALRLGDFALLGTTIIVILAAVLGAYVLFATAARELLVTRRARTWLNRIAACGMGGAAALIASR